MMGKIDWNIAICSAAKPDVPITPSRPSFFERILCCAKDNPEAGAGFAELQKGSVSICTIGTPGLNLQPGSYVVRIEKRFGGGDLPVNLTFALYTDKPGAITVENNKVGAMLNPMASHRV